MPTQTTNGVIISVNAWYKESMSDPQLSEYLFEYSVSIKNSNDFAVKLMRRHWHIFDSQADPDGNRDFHFDIKGAGVLGEQPVIEPLSSFQYNSNCKIYSEIGRLDGSYQMENLRSGRSFQVRIPTAQLLLPAKFN